MIIDIDSQRRLMERMRGMYKTDYEASERYDELTSKIRHIVVPEGQMQQKFAIRMPIPPIVTPTDEPLDVRFVEFRRMEEGSHIWVLM